MTNANLSVLNRVFQSYEALHVYSEFDVIHIVQGEHNIKLPTSLAVDLLEALRLAAEGEI